MYWHLTKKIINFEKPFYWFIQKLNGLKINWQISEKNQNFEKYIDKFSKKLNI